MEEPLLKKSGSSLLNRYAAGFLLLALTGKSQ